MPDAGRVVHGRAAGAPYAAHVVARRTVEEAPEEFNRAVAAVRAVRPRPEVRLEEVPAPQRITPFSLALSGEVVEDDEECASGRFVLLHDPAGQPGWGGTFRVVAYVRAALEDDLGEDPLVGRIGWTWLQECLAACGAEVTEVGATVTRVVSETFGAIEHRPGSVEIEVRASWTPVEVPGEEQLLAWIDLLCTVGGLPPLPQGVAALPRRR